MKTNTTTNTEKKALTVTAENPFEALSAAVTQDHATRKLAWTDTLNSIAAERSLAVIKTASDKAELHELANRMMDGNPADLLDLFAQTGVDALVHDDAAKLDGADEDTLKRMLESRRSDRSKAKRKGIRSSMANCRTYVASMYAELVIRDAMGKPYTGTAGAQAIDVDTTDAEAVSRKVKSLQSKKCRLKKLVEAGDETLREELDATVAEIERLSAYRPTVKSTTVVKSIKVDELRAALASLSEADLTDELRALKERIG